LKMIFRWGKEGGAGEVAYEDQEAVDEALCFAGAEIGELRWRGW
jgi:hypothetical protein